MNHRLSVICTLILFGVCLLFAITPVRKTANNNRTKTSNKDSRVHLMHADKLYYDDRLHHTAQFLIGNVKFNHEGTLMYCDSALFYEATNSFDAFGNVRMVQGDTLTLTSEVLYYNGIDRLARARFNVVLKHLKTILYTDSLDYDRIYDLGYFFEGGRLLDQGNELTSDWGQYQPATHQAVFNYNVRLVNPEPPEPPKTVLVSDTLYYNTNTAVAYVVGPSNVENGESHIYTERGYYHTKTDESYMLDRSILVNEGKHLVGDSVVWNGETKIGEAFGNFVYTDDENKNMLTGNYCYYVDSIGYCEAYDSALVIDFSQKDTLFAHADTFKVFTYYIDTDSMYRVLHAYRHVRAFREDMQAVCDSMVYNSQDSCLVMYYDPILWQEGQQMLGEEIRSFFNDSTLDSVQILRQALSVEKIDSIHYNQIAGHEMHFYFKEGEMYLSTTMGNVYFNYYPFNEDSVMVEMNHTETTLLKLYIEKREVNYVWMPAATGTMYPVPLIPPDELYLSNFAWFDYIRPVDKMDVFLWRGKKSGSELKKSVQRVAPKQKLSDIKKE